MKPAIPQEHIEMRKEELNELSPAGRFQIPCTKCGRTQDRAFARANHREAEMRRLHGCAFAFCGIERLLLEIDLT